MQSWPSQDCDIWECWEVQRTSGSLNSFTQLAEYEQWKNLKMIVYAQNIHSSQARGGSAVSPPQLSCDFVYIGLTFLSADLESVDLTHHGFWTQREWIDLSFWKQPEMSSRCIQVALWDSQKPHAVLQKTEVAFQHLHKTSEDMLWSYVPE